MWDSFLGLLVGIQGRINDHVAGDMRAFAQTHDWWRLSPVLPLGVLFGAIHALTPGHSKTLLASYVAGSRLSVARGVGVAAALSFTHILSAVVIAVLALPLITRTIVGAGRAPLLEDLSRGLIAVIGAWMLVRALRPAVRHPQHHDNGLTFGVVAGLIPCPLTLFTMMLAMSRGVPEAGLVFALAMMVGVGLTLSSLAALSIVTRDRLAQTLALHGPALAKSGRVLEGAMGLLLIGLGALSVVRA